MAIDDQDYYDARYDMNVDNRNGYKATETFCCGVQPCKLFLSENMWCRLGV